eukprot:11502651-Karenia_brevis.AAC.1
MIDTSQDQSSASNSQALSLARRIQGPFQRYLQQIKLAEKCNPDIVFPPMYVGIRYVYPPWLVQRAPRWSEWFRNAATIVKYPTGTTVKYPTYPPGIFLDHEHAQVSLTIRGQSAIELLSEKKNKTAGSARSDTWA